MFLLRLVIIKWIFGAKNFVGERSCGPNVSLTVIQICKKSWKKIKFIESALKTTLRTGRWKMPAKKKFIELVSKLMSDIVLVLKQRWEGPIERIICSPCLWIMLTSNQASTSTWIPNKGWRQDFKSHHSKTGIKKSKFQMVWNKMASKIYLWNTGLIAEISKSVLRFWSKSHNCFCDKAFPLIRMNR